MRLFGCFTFGLDQDLATLRIVLLALSIGLFLLALPFVHRQLTRLRGRCCLLSLCLLLCVCGVFLAGDFLTLFLCFELMSLGSSLWIFQTGNAESEKAGRLYLFFALLGGLLLLLGISLLAVRLGSLDLAELKSLATQVEPRVLYPAALALLGGFGIKVGVLPLHVWMPSAYGTAPATLAGLLSAVLSKCGLFGLVLTVQLLLPGDLFFSSLLLTLGFLTLLCGGVQALLAESMRRLLAGSSLSQMGLMLLSLSLVGFGGEAALLGIRALLLQMLAHGLAKSLLFWEVGEAERLSVGDSWERLRGFARRAFLPALAVLSACATLAGVPLFMGYLGKTLLHEGLLEAASANSLTRLLPALELLFLLGAALSVAYATKLGCLLLGHAPASRHKGYSPLCAISVLLLVVLLLLFALPSLGLQLGGWGSAPLAHVPKLFSWHALSPFLQATSLGLLLLWLAGRLGRRGWAARRSWTVLDTLYRPLVCTLLPRFGELLARLLAGGLEGGLTLLRCTVLRESAPRLEARIPKLQHLRQIRHSLSLTLLLFTWGICVMIAVLCFAFL